MANYETTYTVQQLILFKIFVKFIRFWVNSPRGLTFTWWGCYGLCLTETNRAYPLLFILFLYLFLSFIALSTVFHSINSPQNSPLSDSVPPVLSLPYWFFQLYHHHHLSLNCEGRWGTTDNFATNFLHFFLSSTAFWDLPNSRPVHSLRLSSHLFLCLPCLLPPFTVPCKMVLAPR